MARFRPPSEMKVLELRVGLLEKHLDEKNAALIIKVLRQQNDDLPQALHNLAPEIPVNVLRQAQLIFALAPLHQDHDHADIVDGLLKQDKKSSSLKDVAVNYSLKDLAGLVVSTSSQTFAVSGVATGHGQRDASHDGLHQSWVKVKSGKEAADVVALSPARVEALRFRRHLFRTEPTAVLHRMAKDNEIDPNQDSEVRAGIVKFFENQPDSFDIRRTSTIKALRRPGALKGIPLHKQKLVSERIQNLQRIQALTTHPEAIAALLNSGASSAFQISSIPQKRFVERMQDDIGEEVARNVHDQAMTSRMQNDHALTALMQTVRGTGIAAIDGGSTLESRRALLANELNRSLTDRPRDSEPQKDEPTVDLEAMFGSLDYCECDDCNSVISPAAYFVELLQFLRNNNLHWDKTKWPNSGEDGISKTVLEKLFARRPDLGYLQLTCENTNTVLPYVDLANEVMESFVVHRTEYANSNDDPKKALIDVFNVEDETSSELLSEPQHTNYKAYCILKDAVFPIVNAPYHQALDELRIFLDYLGTSRYELLSNFSPPYRSETGCSQVDDDALREQYEITIRNAATAEFWRMTHIEYIAITRSSYWPKEYWEIKKRMKISDAEYESHIGRKSTWVYWGYETENDLQSQDNDTRLGLKFVKKQLLPRSYILYSDLVDLVKTQYMNPNFPTGHEKIILDSIHFSYSYLMQLVDDKAKTPWKKWERLVNELLHWQPWAKEMGVKDIPAGISLTKKEIFCWVKTWFEAVGRLIVLESGQTPKLPVEGPVVSYTPPPPPPPNPGVPSLALTAAATPADTTPILFDPQATGAKLDKLGYLDRDGNIMNGDVKVGFVGTNSVVLGNNTQALMEDHKGQLILVLNSAVTNFDNIKDLNMNEVVAYVTEDTSSLAWPDAKGPNFAANNSVTNPLPKLIQYLAATETCNIDDVVIQHLDGSPLSLEEWDRMQAFLRLWRRLGWTINETDQALKGLAKPPEQCADSNSDAHEDSINDWSQVIDDTCCECSSSKGDCNCGSSTPQSDDCCDSTGPPQPLNITAHLLEELVAVKQLQDLTGIDLMQLLCLWTAIPTEGNPSLYSTLFLVHNVYAIDKVFKADSDGNFLTKPAKISEHIPVILAALRLTLPAVENIYSAAKITDVLTLESITKLYSYCVLTKVLGVKAELTPEIIRVCGDPFLNSTETLRVLNTWEQIQDHGFDLSQMKLLLFNENDPLRPLGPDKSTILKTTKLIMDGLLSIDTDNPDLSDEDMAKMTPDFVSSKITLLFPADTTAAIMALLQGTTPYSTNAPPGLKLSIPDNLKAKFVYADVPNTNPPRATLSVSGILTVDETAAAQKLVPGKEWSDALVRIGKKPSKFFDENLIGIFPDEAAAKVVLLAGDIPPPPPPSSASDPVPVDNSTFKPKSIYFLRYFLPLLRNALRTRFIIDAVGSAASIATPELTNILLSKVVRVGNGAIFGLAALETIHETSDATASSFEGYLIPTATDNFVFFAGGFESEPAPLMIDGQTVPLSHRQEDPNDTWYSDAVPLVNGRLTKLTTTGQPASNLQWKTARSSVSSIPSSALLPEESSSTTGEVFEKLFRTGIILNNFNLSVDEVSFFLDNAGDFQNLDLNNLNIQTWQRLANYTNLRDSLPKLSNSLIDFFKWAKAGKNPEKLVDMLQGVTNWKSEILKPLFNVLQLTSLKPFVNEIILNKLSKMIGIQQKTGVDPSLLSKWCEPLSFFWKESRQIAESVRNTVRARYDVDTWERLAQPLFNKLRENQRDALIAFLLVQKSLKDWGVVDADSLFEFFLIDVQMSSCLQTSRIKQAISTVQLFVQRCLLGLEAKFGVQVTDIDQDRWLWMGGIGTWVANKKIFMFTETWLDPTLRDDKSEIFQTLESKLLQKDVSPQAVQDAFKNYLFGVDQVASLQTIGLVIDPVPEKSASPISSVIHIFAKTRSAPYFFFYRQFKLLERNWTPWETMQVDIATYEDEDKNGTVTASGSYLLPVIYNGRLLVFLPQFTKKTLPVQTTQGATSVIKLGDSDVNQNVPASYWEIKMGWSEYRNGKWTQKKATTTAISKVPTIEQNTPVPDIPDVSGYQFVPKVISGDISYVLIGAFDKDKAVVGWFKFDGSLTATVGDGEDVATFALSTSPTNPYKFQASQNQDGPYINSYQDTDADPNLPLDLINSRPWVHWPKQAPLLGEISLPSDPPDSTNFPPPQKFYDPFSAKLLGTATASPTIDGVFQFYESVTKLEDKALLFGNSETTPTPSSDYHELKTPYAIYNWEIGVHAPMLLMNKLLSVQLFDQALEVAHYVFNPFATRSNPPLPGDLWRFPPFKNVMPSNVLEATFAQLDPNTPVPADNVINEWRDNAFQPHVVARGRRVAYMKWFAVQYIKILIAYGDYYFTQNTLESVPLAIQLYVRAAHLYGPKGQMIPKRGKKKVETYMSLLDSWDGFSNAVTQMELMFPFSNQSKAPLGKLYGKNVLANIFGFATSRYFCIPNNPDLAAVRDLIDDRLYKIRHCQDINGVVRQLALWEPPIDPGLLVQAAAAGISFASVISDLNSPMANYRFFLLLQKALEFCSELKSMAGQFVSVKEKIDAEALANLRASQESTMAGLIMELKRLALEDANKSLEALQYNRQAPVYRLKHFLALIGGDPNKIPTTESDFTELENRLEALLQDGSYKLVPTEKHEMDKSNQASEENSFIGEIEALSGYLHMIPTNDIAAQPWGMGINTKWGPQSFAHAASATARKMKVGTDSTSSEASNAGRMTSFLRQLQDRVHQANNAGYEIKNIDKQIETQNQKIAVAAQDVTNQQQAIDHANEIVEFLKNKYSNEALYSWMEDNLRTLHYQTYTLAYQLAKKAERAFTFERGLDPSEASFISFGYWDANRDGILAGERLYLGLKQLEAAYQADRGHDYEMTKMISLRQTAPLALVQLRELGSCEITLPEVLFDMDFPGHFHRRIKSVSLTFPCIVGPYTNISCTLRLLDSEYRVTATGARSASDYPRTAADDSRFRQPPTVPIAAVALSTAQNDAGVFELNFKDDRYVPFEGAGAISRWSLELPTHFRAWDYGTLTDVVMTMKYTSREGGNQLSLAAAASVKSFINRIESTSRDDGLFAIFDLRSDFRQEWAKAATPPVAGAPEQTKKMVLTDLQDRLPVFTRPQGKLPPGRSGVTADDVWIVLSKGSWVQSVNLIDKTGSPTALTAGEEMPNTVTLQSLGVGVDLGTWELEFAGSADGDRLMKGLLVVRYTIARTSGGT